MRAIFVLFDSLNRGILECYGSDLMETPNFKRLAERTLVFDNHYVGSLPCMPARRDLQSGRISFLHRSWGPMEPFDNSLPEMLKSNGVYSHLITDHYHYFEDGGATYHTRFSSYEFVRGQEGDRWKAMVQPPWERLREKYHPSQFDQRPGSLPYHYMINREYMREEKDFPCVNCFRLANEFLDANHAADDWFLQIETFDPHEPFYAPPRFREKFKTDYRGGIRDWPPYSRVTEHKAECDELRANYMALVALCDEQMGKLIDKMDALDMWKDTVLVVTTDHGYLLGEHDWWAKNRMHAYQEIVHIPLFMHHPDFRANAGRRRSLLTQTPDLMPTFLDLFGIPTPAGVTGKSIRPSLTDDGAKLRDALIYGYYGGAVNVTDGRYTYFRYPENLHAQELFQYTLMPTHMLQFFNGAEIGAATMAPGGAFSRGMPTLKIPVPPSSAWYQSHGPAKIVDTETVLFDLQSDPQQLTPIPDRAIEAQLATYMSLCLQEQDAPREVYRRLALTGATRA
jgi:arylsulfatase A-like enzyme